MTLALLLTAVTGAWAQTAFGVKEITADMLPASWSTDESAVTADDLAKFGFMEVTEAEAQAWTGAPQQGNVRLIYTPCKSVNWVNGEGGYSTSSYTRKIFYSCLNGQRIFITTEVTEWSLTPDETGKTWTLAKMPASDVELQVEYEPTKVTMAANDNAMGTVEVAGESKVEWTADTWKDWTADTKVYTVDDITMTSTESAHIRKYTSEDDNYNNSLFFLVRKQVNDATVTFSTTGDPFSRIEFTMIGDYSQYNPDIIPNDNWTFEGKSAVWEGEATKSLTLQSCSTNVSKITFFKGDIPDGVTVNGDGTFTVAKTATVTLKATPAEGYKFLYWEDDQTNTNPVREVTIESGMADKTYKAVFAEITYNVTFVEGTNPDEWTVTPGTEVKKDTQVDVKYTGTKKVLGMKVEKKAESPSLNITSPEVGQVIGSDGKNYAYGSLPTGVTAVAKICYVSGSNGLALALTDEEGTMNWSTAQTTCAAHTPAFTGGTWKLASKDEWDNMISTAGSYSDLRDGFSSVGGTNMQSACYWSSSEDDSDYAWGYGFDFGFWSSVSKGFGYYVRPCLAF